MIKSVVLLRASKEIRYREEQLVRVALALRGAADSPQLIEINSEVSFVYDNGYKIRMDCYEDYKRKTCLSTQGAKERPKDF